VNKAAKLASRICDAMERQAPRAALAPLARDYALLCEEANHRLGQCAAMLGHGQNYQALELAETDPALLDLVAALSFKESQEWRLLCQREDLPVGEKLDELSIRRLNELYSRGGVGQRRLYRQYRHNILEHNHRAAIRTLRTLCKVDPRDTNAHSELERLDKNVTRDLAEQLREAVDCGIQDRAAALMEEFDSEPWLNLPSGPFWEEGLRMRRELERERARAECAERILALPDLKAADRWQEASALIDQAEDRLRELGTSLDETSARVLEAHKAWAGERQETFRQHELRAQRMTDLRNRLEKFDPRRPELTLEALRTHHREMKGLADALHGEEGPGSPGLDEDVAGHLREVKSVIGRRVFRIWLKRCAVFGLVALLAGGIAFFSWASSLLEHGPAAIQKLVDEGKMPEATSRLVWLQRLQASPMGNRKEVGEAIPKLDTQVRKAEGARDAYAGHLSRLTAWSEMDFSGRSLSELLREYDALQTDRKAVAPGYLPAFAKEEGALRKRWQDYLTAQRESSIGLLRESLRILDGSASVLAVHDPEELRAALQKLRPQLEVIRQLRSPALAGLSLPPELMEKAAAAESSWQPAFETMQKLDAASLQLRSASTLEEYLAALQSVAALPWDNLPEVRDAKTILALKPTTEEILGGLLAPGHPGLVQPMADAKTLPPLYPAAPNEEEAARYVELRDDPALGALYRCVITNTTGSRNTGTRTVYSRGQPQRKDSVIGDKVLRKEWAAELYDPAKSPESVSFEKATLVLNLKQSPASGQQMLEESLTAESEHFRRIGLAELADASGGAFQNPILKVLDVLRSNPDVNPLFKAYLQLQLTGLARLRPAEWGLWLAPSAERDAAELETLTGGSLLETDWINPKRSAALRDKLARFYERTGSLSYLKEAQIHRQVVRTFARSGLQFAGYAGPDGAPVLRAGFTGTGRLWGLGEEKEGDGLLFRQRTDGGWDAVGKPLPFTPLFASSLDPAAVWKQACEADQADPNDPLLAKGMPPIFQ
jgi:hypothetical protein